jgi:hypothetical protein
MRKAFVSQPIFHEGGRIQTITPDGKWLIEVVFDSIETERLDSNGYLQQREIIIRDRIKHVICAIAEDHKEGT